MRRQCQETTSAGARRFRWRPNDTRREGEGLNSGARMRSEAVHLAPASPPPRIAAVFLSLTPIRHHGTHTWCCCVTRRHGRRRHYWRHHRLLLLLLLLRRRRRGRSNGCRGSSGCRSRSHRGCYQRLRSGGGQVLCCLALLLLLLLFLRREQSLWRRCSRRCDRSERLGHGVSLCRAGGLVGEGRGAPCFEREAIFYSSTFFIF